MMQSAANSPPLWEAAYRLPHGDPVNLRTIPSIVGGDPKTRHGIVLSKSIPAKQYGIQTGETLYAALKKCPHLTIVQPSYDLDMKCSMLTPAEPHQPGVELLTRRLGNV